jgi:hypothetical protein
MVFEKGDRMKEEKLDKELIKQFEYFTGIEFKENYYDDSVQPGFNNKTKLNLLEYAVFLQNRLKELKEFKKGD